MFFLQLDIVIWFRLAVFLVKRRFEIIPLNGHLFGFKGFFSLFLIVHALQTSLLPTHIPPSFANFTLRRSYLIDVVEVFSLRILD